MRHEANSLMTKTALSASLKKLMNTNLLSKISVRQIIEDCGVNRKTFYYHFQNINDLLKWTFEQEVFEIVKQYDFSVDFDDVIRFAMNYVEENKHICNCALDELGRDELKRFFQKDFFSIIESIVTQFSEGKKIPEDFKNFIINFYTEALASMIIDWIRNKDTLNKEVIAKYISLTLLSTIENALETAEKNLSN